MRDISFKRASPEDADLLVSLEMKVDVPKLYGPTLDARSAARDIEENNFFFIYRSGVAVGTAAYRILPDESAYISNIAVDPVYHRLGIGRLATMFIMEKCKEAPRIRLVTHPENFRALRLYVSLGFAVDGRHENYFGDG